MLAKKVESDGTESMDKEWIDLLRTAKAMGMTTDEIRAFLEKRSAYNHKNNRENSLK